MRLVQLIFFFSLLTPLFTRTFAEAHNQLHPLLKPYFDSSPNYGELNQKIVETLKRFLKVDNLTMRPPGFNPERPPSVFSNHFDQYLMKELELKNLVYEKAEVHFNNLDDQDFINSLWEKDPNATKLKATEKLKTQIEAFTKDIEPIVKNYMNNMLWFCPTNRYRWQANAEFDFGISSVTSRLIPKVFKLIDISEDPDQINKYYLSNNIFARFVKWIKRIFLKKTDPVLVKDPRYLEKREAYENIFENMLKSYHNKQDSKFYADYHQAYTFIYEFYNNFGTFIEASFIFLTEDKNLNSKSVNHRIERLQKMLSWHKAALEAAPKFFDFCYQSKNWLGMESNLNESFGSFFTVNKKSTQTEFRSGNLIEPREIYFKIAALLDDMKLQEISLTMLSSLYTNYAFMSRSFQEISYQETAQYFYSKLPKAIPSDFIGPYAAYLAEYLSWLPTAEDNGKIENFGNIVRELTRDITPYHFLLELGTTFTKIFYAPILLNQNGYKLPNFEDALLVPVMGSFNQTPLENLELYPLSLDTYLNTQLKNEIGSHFVKEYYPILKLINLWGVHKRETMPMVMFIADFDPNLVEIWKKRLDEVDSKGTIWKIIQRLVINQVKGENLSLSSKPVDILAKIGGVTVQWADANEIYEKVFINRKIKPAPEYTSWPSYSYDDRRIV